MCSLRELVHGRRVSVQMFSKDRFGRIARWYAWHRSVMLTSHLPTQVGMAYVRKFPWVRRTNVSEAMLKSGCESLSRCHRVWH